MSCLGGLVQGGCRLLSGDLPVAMHAEVIEDTWERKLTGQRL